LKPYFKNQGITIFNADCVSAMKEMEDKAFDLAIVDPPYGINAPNMTMGTNESRSADGYPATSTADRLRKGRLNQGAGKLKNRNLQRMSIAWDYEKPSPEYFSELQRVSKNQIIWGGNYFDLGPTRCVICWDKIQPWENFSQWEMAWTSFDKPASIFHYSNTGGANLEKKIHPTQKPAALYRWLLSKYAKPGSTLLDTHLGSGSIAIACHDLGFTLTAYEIDEEYCAAAAERISRHQNQEQLNFGGN
jgi:site-specific DNA-methyltransferase (adenine-specific)